MHQDDNLQANQKFQFSNWRWKQSWKSIWAKAPANQYIDKVNVLQKIKRFPDGNKNNWIKLEIKIEYFIYQKDFCSPYKLTYVSSKLINLQGYDLISYTSDMWPTGAWTHKMIIPICYSTIGIIECLKKIKQSFTWTLAKVEHPNVK